jgi:hypothetical protein
MSVVAVRRGRSGSSFLKYEYARAHTHTCINDVDVRVRQKRGKGEKKRIGRAKLRWQVFVMLLFFVSLVCTNISAAWWREPSGKCPTTVLLPMAFLFVLASLAETVSVRLRVRESVLFRNTSLLTSTHTHARMHACTLLPIRYLPLLFPLFLPCCGTALHCWDSSRRLWRFCYFLARWMLFLFLLLLLLSLFVCLFVVLGENTLTYPKNTLSPF